MSDLWSSGVGGVGNALIAIGALGTASYGLVDVTKALPGGGLSMAGFGEIRKAVTPFASALTVGAGAHWPSVLQSHWVNGGALDDQKAKAKALIRLGLTTANAATMAAEPSIAGRIDGAALATAVTHMNTGTPLTPVDLNELGRFDAIVSAALDAGFEIADQRYRAYARALAWMMAIALAEAAAVLIDRQMNRPFGWSDFATAVLIGLVATPLAPVAKDLASALNTAASAFKAAKG